MSAIERLNFYVNMLITATFIIVIVVGAIVFYLLKIKKVTAKEEKINYDTFRRRDVKEFLKFDNIISCSTGNGGGTFGIAVVNDNTFIAAMDVKGYNFSSASEDERKRTIINSVSFFNLIERPVQMRQTVKAIDISYNIEKQTEVCKSLARKQMDYSAEYKDTLSLMDEIARDLDHEDSDSLDLYAAAERRLLELQKLISSTRWMYQEATEVLNYMKSYTASGQAKKVNQLVFSYTFNPSDYTQELSDEEIYMKASSELALMANNFASALSSCGCTCRLLTGMEFMDLIRRHNHPKTADEVHIEDLFNSSYQALFISSDSLLKAERRRVGEAAFQKKVREYQEMVDSKRKLAEKEQEDFRQKLSNSVEDFVAKEVQEED